MEHEPEHEQPPARLGRYELVESLGRGGMGHVFRARAYAAAGVTKDVCIKRIRPERLGDEGAVRRFIAEARLSVGLSHANIVSVFDFGRGDDGYFLAMEWVDGADLRSILDDGPLPPACAAFVGAAVARALAYAHDPQGVATVHRDVKPANVLVSLAGDVKLADFGVAAAIGSQRGVAGTEGYMAPEQREGAEPTGAADLFSLGVVLREMLDVVPAPLEPLVASLLADDPRERPVSADEVAEALEAFVASERVGGAPSPRETLRARTRRARRPGAPMRDAFGAELSFLRDGSDATFHQRMEPSAPTEPLHPQPPRPWWAAWALWATAAAAAGGAVASVGLGARDEPRPLASRTTPAPEERPATPAPPAPHPPAPTPAPAPQPATPQPATPQPATPTDPPAPTDAPTQPATPHPAAAETRDEPDETTVPPMATDPTTMRGPARAQPTGAQAPAASPRRTPTLRGTLEVNAIPWAHVFVDGRSAGETPLLGLRLDAGVHAIRLVNEPLGASRELRVEIRPGEASRVVVQLEPP